jgi:4-aminobutyrate aminotransferase / (S)-3-amino-2-methylpropionate transaminase / 5-aminovalerate transaminase
MDVPNIKVTPPGPKARAVLEKQAKYLAPSVSEPIPLVWDHAKDCTVWDVDDNSYIDFCSGVLVLNTGHSHPKVVKALQDQVGKLINCYDSPHPLRSEFAEAIAKLMPENLHRVLFLSSGSEAIDAAVKISRAYTGRYEILSFYGAFHGRTYMPMSVGGKGAIKRPFGPFVPGILHAPFPYCYRCPFKATYPECDLVCFDFIERTLECTSGGSLAAAITEPYQGASGGIFPPKEWVQRLRQLCTDRNMLFIFDEVQSCFGRTGTMFAFEQYGVVPDIVTLAKGLASGVPASAVVARNEIMESLKAGSISSTYGGNPLVCAAGLASIEIIQEERLAQNAAHIGRVMIDHMLDIQKRYPIIGDVRGMGLAQGIELVRDRKTKEPAGTETTFLVEESIRRGLALIPPIGFYGNVIRFAPPLTISEAMAHQGLDLFESALKSMS